MVVAYDVTVSFEKSISLAWARATPEERGTIDAGTNAAVAYLEDHAVAVRRGRGAEKADGVWAGSYRHLTNRNLEPQLHDHVVIANIGAADGRTQALDSRLLHHHAKTAGYVAGAVTRRHLSENSRCRVAARRTWPRGHRRCHPEPDRHVLHPPGRSDHADRRTRPRLRRRPRLPNQRRSVQSLMADAAVIINPEAAIRYVDLAAFEVTVLGPERTLAEKLAFLHHRATRDDLTALAAGARHLYDVAMLLSNPDVRNALQNPDVIRELMIDIDARSDAAGWPYTPRPESGFASSPAFTGQPDITDSLTSGYARLDELIWRHQPSFAEAIDIVRTHHGLI